MMKRKSLLIALAVIFILLGVSMLTYGVSREERKVVKLPSQKQEIDKELTLKEVDNVNFFRGEEWFQDGRILGVKDQAEIETDNKLNAKLCIYNPKDKKFDCLVEAKKNERLYVGQLLEDERYVTYSIFSDEDFRANGYDYYLLDLQTKKTKKLVSNMTATSNREKNKEFVAAGWQLYEWTLEGQVTEVILPQGLIEKLKSFDDFPFEAYLKTFYNKDNLTKEQLDMIKVNYDNDKKYNAIRRVTQEGNELFLESANTKTFAYNMKHQTYRLLTEEEITAKEKLLYPYGPNFPSCIKQEFKEDGTREIWTVDDKGEKLSLIEAGNINWNVIQSPDERKIVYYMEGKNGETNTYIYDLDKKQKIKVFLEVREDACWHKDSKKFFISSWKKDEQNRRHDITSIVSLNE